MHKRTAAGLAALGLMIGVVWPLSSAASAHATTEPPHTVVLWSVPDGADPLTTDQPYVTSTPGTSLDALNGSMQCGTTYQVDVYRSVDEHGTPVSSLWADGVLHPNHDGGFLAYDVLATPYRVVTTEPCPEPTPEPTPPVETPEPTPPTPVVITDQPAAPTVHDECGTEHDHVTIPADTDRWTYESIEDGASTLVRVVARDGFLFPETAVTSWTFTLTNEPCPTETPTPTPTPTPEPTPPVDTPEPSTEPTPPTDETTPPAPSSPEPSVTPTPESAPPTSSTPTPSATPTVVPVVDDTTPRGTLAYTGADRDGMVVGGISALALAALGSALMVIRHRRARSGGE